MPADIVAAPVESVSGVAAGDGLSDMAFLDQTLASIHPADVRPNDLPPNAEGNSEVTDGEALDQAIADEKKTPTVAGQKPGQDPAKPGQDPQAAKPDKVETPAAEADEEIGDETSLTVASLQKRLSTSPDFKKAIEADPELRRQLFYTARRADRATKYDELFQTPDLARDMKGAADEAYERRELYSNDPQKFLQKLVFDSFVKDDQGRVKLENGQPVMNGAYNAVVSTYRNVLYSQIENIAKEMITKNLVGDKFNGQDVNEALRIFKAVVEGGPQSNPEEAEASLPDHVKRELAEARKLKADSDVANSKTLETFSVTTREKMSDAVRTDVKNLLAKRLPANSAIGDYIKEKVVDDTVREIERLATANRAHMDWVNRSMKSVSRDENGTKTIVQARQGFAKELAPRILARFLQQATNAVVSQNTSTTNKVHKQSRPEVVSSGGVKAPSRPDAKQAGQKVVVDARKQGRAVKDMDIVNAVVDAQTR